jgi:hypothetical protein
MPSKVFATPSLGSNKDKYNQQQLEEQHTDSNGHVSNGPISSVDGIDKNDMENPSSSSSNGWAFDFVRRMAAEAVMANNNNDDNETPYLVETSLDEDRQVLSFHHKPQNTDIEVHYMDRIVMTLSSANDNNNSPATDPNPLASSPPKYYRKISHYDDYRGGELAIFSNSNGGSITCHGA